ncbi:MAG: hypothetical protein Q9194_004510 [Teloschistes cf. exilis]
MLRRSPEGIETAIGVFMHQCIILGYDASAHLCQETDCSPPLASSRFHRARQMILLLEDQVESPVSKPSSGKKWHNEQVQVQRYDSFPPEITEKFKVGPTSPATTDLRFLKPETRDSMERKEEECKGQIDRWYKAMMEPAIPTGLIQSSRRIGEGLRTFLRSLRSGPSSSGTRTASKQTCSRPTWWDDDANRPLQALEGTFDIVKRIRPREKFKQLQLDILTFSGLQRRRSLAVFKATPPRSKWWWACLLSTGTPHQNPKIHHIQDRSHLDVLDSPQDQAILEAAFNHNPKPDKSSRTDIASKVSLGGKEEVEEEADFEFKPELVMAFEEYADFRTQGERLAVVSRVSLQYILDVLNKYMISKSLEEK